MWNRALLLFLAFCQAVHGGECQRGQGRDQCNSGPTLLQYVSRVRQHDVPSLPVTAETSNCAPFKDWPDVDNGVTCGGCRALVLTAPYGGVCEKYCASFGHKCVAAAEERSESCTEQESYRCDEEISGTSDMLCTCERDGVCWDGLGGLVEDEGNEVGKFETTSVEECESSCNENEECKSVTFCESWGACFHKDRALTGMETASRNPDCKSYFKKPCGSAPVSKPPWSGGGGGGGKSLVVTVVSYNLYWWNAFDQNPWKSDHIIRNIKQNLKPDSIGLQECDSPGTVGNRAGLEQASRFEGAQGVMVKPGLFTKGDSGSRDLQATGKWGPRYVTWVELTDPSSRKTFWHFNTHWCVHNGNGRVCNEEVRYRGAQNMLAVIQEKAGDKPVVITGDFNARLEERGPQHFLANGFKLAESDWVDKIFYSHHWKLRKHGAGDSAHSDHRPIYAEFELE